ncbi:MAG: alcohol dehydrogenase catalytic domain-containing protein [Lachnospiraceae bacterium]|nr:alcohol dehydrogenase catalytic domain-containing protein [Lachnospiraceae bacterium]
MSEPVMMKAVVTYAPGDMRYEDYPKPVPGEGEILLKMKGCSICAGDLKAWHGGIRFWGTSEADRYIEGPCIQGHEFFGEVVELGPGAEGFEIGDNVCAEQIVPCGECEFCRTGRHWMCTRSAVFGFKNYCNGGFAEYINLPATSLKHKLPASFTQEQSVLVEPIACGMHALEQAHVQHEDVVVIAGLGAIGLSICNIANQAMPKLLIGIEVRPERAQKALEYGADIVLDPTKCDVAEEIRKLTGGLGCDVYVEASGAPKSVTQGMDCLKNLGRYVQMGVVSDFVKTDWNLIGDGKELTIIGSHLSAKVYPAVIRGMEKGLIRTDGLISHKFRLKDWEQAFETAASDPNAVKVMLEP